MALEDVDQSCRAPRGRQGRHVLDMSVLLTVLLAGAYCIF